MRSPLFEAQNAPRYERQELIRKYQSEYDCRLVVMADVIFADSITLFEETLFDATQSQDLHVILHTLGGDGETAIRLIRQAQARCKELTVIKTGQFYLLLTRIWRLWTKYRALGNVQVYEGERASVVVPQNPHT